MCLDAIFILFIMLQYALLEELEREKTSELVTTNDEKRS